MTGAEPCGLGGPLSWSAVTGFTSLVVSEGSSSATWLLALGASTGLAFALWTVADPGARTVRAILDTGLDPAKVATAVAMVNEHPISLNQYQRALERVPEAQRSAKSTSTRVLKHLVEEELLLQRGESLGLHRADPEVRRALVRAVLATEQTLASFPPVSEDDLQLFYEEVKAEFTRPASLYVRQVLVSAEDTEHDPKARAIARRAASMLRMGMDYDHVCRVAHCVADPAIPDGPIAIPDLEALLGPQVVAELRQQEPGAVLDVISHGHQHRVLQLQKVVAAKTPPFEQLRDQLESRYYYEQQLDGLSETLAALRERAHVVTRHAP